ncbi:MAG: mechanosensitive ion channel domain-containing protein, partial [Leptolyngbyaceae bacterium]|nr:mechanosensitive ion channel domain-containing protein [Leptolyngbyaceae bacterium]
MKRSRFTPIQWRTRPAFARQWSGRHLWLGLLAAVALSVGLLLGPVSSSVRSAPLPATSTLPEVLNPFGSATVGEALPTVLNLAEAEPVTLDGRILFFVADTDQVSASARAALISQRLDALASGGGSLEVGWSVDDESQLPLLTVNGSVLMTVTKADAQLKGLPRPGLLATELVTSLEDALSRYREERQPDYLRNQFRTAALGLVLLILASVGISRVQTLLRQRIQRIKHRKTTPDDAPSLMTPNLWPPSFSDRSPLTKIAFQRWVCRVLQVVIWLGGLWFLMSLFPYTRQWQPWMLQFTRTPLKIAVLVLVLYGLIRFGHGLVDRVFLFFQVRADSTKQRSLRVALRFSTASSVAKHVMAAFLIAVGVLASLALLGVDLAPLIAGAGILSLAISFASQNVIRDVINGFLILIEDQFGVGDVIVVGDVAGFVENMNLRITQLRNEEGRLITIPNGQITVVQNLSKEWSRVDLLIPVALSSDIDRAIAIIGDVAE